MAKGYSKDLRERAVLMVEGGESRREAARVLNLAPATVVRWLDRWCSTGSVAAKPGTGHSRSPLETHAKWLLDLVAQEPGLTLEEIRDRASSREETRCRLQLRLALLRAPQDHVQKKSCTRPSRIGLTSPPHARS